jgi:putative phosphoribosyl transferase
MPFGARQSRFNDRRDAGRQLAARLLRLGDEAPVVVGLARGGIPVAAEVATALGAPLEVLAVRKLGAPHNPEYGIGAIVEDGTRVIDPEALSVLEIDNALLDSLVARESAELRRQVSAYRGKRQPRSLQGRSVIIVDDGVATGITDTAALRSIRHQGPRRLRLAIPVCAPDSLVRLQGEADEVVCLVAPSLLRGVGQWYEDFSQVTDQEVISALGKPEADRRVPADGAAPPRP